MMALKWSMQLGPTGPGFRGDAVPLYTHRPASVEADHILKLRSWGVLGVHRTISALRSRGASGGRGRVAFEVGKRFS